MRRLRVWRSLPLAVALLALTCLRGAAPLEGAGAQTATQVHVKLDFDDGANPFTTSGNGAVAAVDAPAETLSGRSLSIRRAAAGGYFGAVAPLQISGSGGLRIAFMLRARGVHSVSINAFDELARDNTTPASPARVADDAWRPVVFAVEDFHHNSGQPDRKIPADTRFSSVMLYGRDNGPDPAIWIDKLVIYRTPDRTAPEAPAALRASPGIDGSIALSWQEPPDETFAAIYSIHRRVGAGAWEKIAESPRPAYRDSPRSAEPHWYRVTAADYENNVSAPSAEVTVTPSSPPAAARAAADAAVSPWVADRMNYASRIREIHARGAGTVRRDVFLFAGDSITAAALYTHALGSWLARGLTVRQGVGRMTTGFGAANIKRYLADARPEFAVVMYGTNDLTLGESIGGAMRNLGAIVDACVEAGTVPVLATIPPRGFDAGRQGDAQRFNRDLARLAREKQIPVSYAFEEMLKEKNLRTILSDGIHLTPARGNDVAGRALRQTMDQVYFALRDTSGRE